MLKKTITYQDLDGNSVTEDFYFNLSKAEIAEMELSHDGGFSAHMQRIMQADKPDGALIMKTFKEIVAASVGRRSEDNKSFIKNEQIKQEFLGSDAYSELFMELVTNAEASAAFVVGIVPKDLQEELEKQSKATDAQPAKVQDVPLPDKPEAPPVSPWIAEGREPTDLEIRNMSPEELREAFRRKNQSSGG